MLEVRGQRSWYEMISRRVKGLGKHGVIIWQHKDSLQLLAMTLKKDSQACLCISLQPRTAAHV